MDDDAEIRTTIIKTVESGSYLSYLHLQWQKLNSDPARTKKQRRFSLVLDQIKELK